MVDAGKELAEKIVDMLNESGLDNNETWHVVRSIVWSVGESEEKRFRMLVTLFMSLHNAAQLREGVKEE